jgi:predicted unusual protein kinase regulating ubiquinone biosynthesis (AarF/ABC1/UbiB family)
VTPRGDLAIFDAGLVKRFSDRFVEEFLSFSRCLMLGTARDFVEHFRRFNVGLTADWSALEQDLQALMERFQSQSTAELEMGEFNGEMFALFRKHNIRPQPEITLVMVGSMTLEGIGKILDPSRNQFKDMAAYIVGMMLRRVAERGEWSPAGATA